VSPFPYGDNQAWDGYSYMLEDKWIEIEIDGILPTSFE
jgi:hypothetical protein